MRKYIDCCEWAETIGETLLARELGCICFIQPFSADLRHIARGAGALSSPRYTRLGFVLPSRSVGWLFALGWVSTFATKSSYDELAGIKVFGDVSPTTDRTKVTSARAEVPV